MSVVAAIPRIHVVGFSGRRQISDSGAADQAIRDALESLRAKFYKDFSPGDWAEAQQQLAGAEHLRIIQSHAAREDAYVDCGLRPRWFKESMETSTVPPPAAGL